MCVILENRRRNALTIAAGFAVRDGLLLCSDSQYSGWEKVYKDKLFCYQFGAVMVSFALAGDDDYGCTVIDDCYEGIAAMPSDRQTVWNVRKTIRRAIKRVLKDCSSETLKPEFLIGISSFNEGSFLFSSRGASIPRVDRFDFRGSGAYIAHYIMKSLDPMRVDLMDLEEAALIGFCILSAAKRNDTNCGGGSQFLAIRGMGAFQFGANPLDVSGHYMDHYEYFSRSLMTYMGDVSMPDDEFKRHLKGFCEAVMKLRADMCGATSHYRMLIESLRQAGSRDPGSTKSELPNIQP
jgi:hypothetical protein